MPRARGKKGGDKEKQAGTPVVENAAAAENVDEQQDEPMDTDGAPVPAAPPQTFNIEGTLTDWHYFKKSMDFSSSCTSYSQARFDCFME
jgi:hypothetical protein